MKPFNGSLCRDVCRESPETPGYSFSLADSEDLRLFRDMQVKELRGTAQDGTEEGIVTYGADFVKIAKSGETAGYACVGARGIYKGVILEYYLISECRADSAGIIMCLAKKYGCAQWLVNTQDFFAFPVMLDLGLKYAIDAYKFAIDDSIKTEYELGPEISVKAAAPEEIAELYRLITQDGFYTGGDINSLIPTIAANEIYLMRKNGILTGAGFVGAIKRTPGYADIAMIIDREHRGRGYGVLLVKYLTAKCGLLNLIPTAVCDVKNTASRRVLQKVGFHLDGCLLLAQTGGDI